MGWIPENTTRPFPREGLASFELSSAFTENRLASLGRLRAVEQSRNDRAYGITRTAVVEETEGIIGVYSYSLSTSYRLKMADGLDMVSIAQALDEDDAFEDVTDVFTAATAGQS